VFGALAITPFGGWLQSFFYGTGVRWHEAYSALEAGETNLPRDERERERLLIASARTESEPPIGMKVGPRLHPVGTLARLHYQTLDERGERLNEWDVRALVPRLADDEDPFWRERCNQPCRDEVERGEGVAIRRSGDPGIAPEWILRMPVAKTFEVNPAGLRTQDILDSAPRRIVLRYVQVGDRPALRPAKIRVTLVEACPATVRVGTALNLGIYPNAIVPIPSGFAASRWAQVDGCGKLAPLPPPTQAEEPLARVKPDIAEAPDLHSIVVRREAATGHADLIVDEGWLQKHNMPVVFQVAKICRYDAAANRWQRLPAPAARNSSRLVPLPAADASKGARVAL